MRRQGADLERLREAAREIRVRVLKLARQSGSGHIGSSLSCVDLLVALFRRFLRFGDNDRRDRFIMSKGHACVPYYCCLESAGLLPRGLLDRYGEDGIELGHHPDRAPHHGIDIGTGSLGHGLPVAAGLALAARRAGRPWRAVVLMSDGEQEEGSVWEAAAFAAHHRLDNLLAVVDFNKMQAFGRTEDVVSLEPLHDRYASFGWAAHRLDGHDLRDIVSALECVPFEPGRPSVIVADTVKGKGVSFMENSLLWHYRCPDDKEFAAALRELEGH